MLAADEAALEALALEAAVGGVAPGAADLEGLALGAAVGGVALEAAVDGAALAVVAFGNLVAVEVAVIQLDFAFGVNQLTWLVKYWHFCQGRGNQ